MEEKFYLTNSYKYSVLFFLGLVSYNPVLSMLNSEFGFPLLVVSVLWLIHVYSWIKPAVTLTSTELLINWIGYGKKQILLSAIKTIEIKGRNNLHITFTSNGKIESQVISSSIVDNTRHLAEQLKLKN